MEEGGGFTAEASIRPSKGFRAVANVRTLKKYCTVASPVARGIAVETSLVFVPPVGA
ncbi:MAG: hypothetical protein HY900_00820 [Deltaproteobacteria bacterium]|nr:hypothetical protein [Deltaproteobacteria bacterium]